MITAILFYALTLLAVMYLTWVLFVAIICLRMVRDAGRLTKLMMPFGYITLTIGLLLDAALNLLMSIPLLELPQYQLKEILLTARLKRLIIGGGWRATQAKFWCRNFLTPIDPSHCGEYK